MASASSATSRLTTSHVVTSPLASSQITSRQFVNEPLEDDEEQLLSVREVFEFLPSWLVSLVVHLSLVLLLALFQVIGEGGFSESTIVLDVQADGPQGAEEDPLLAAAIELPSELTASQTVETAVPEVTELASPLDAMSKIELMDPTGGAGKLPGTSLEGGGSNPIETAIFGLRGEGKDFVYVFDRSDSMNSTFSYASEGETLFSITPLEAAKAELLRSIADLGGGHRFHIVFYNHDTWVFDRGSGSPRELIEATADSKLRAKDFVATVYGHGRTKHVPPLEIALKMRPDVIFLLTDGEDKDDPSPAEIGRLRRLNGGRTKINVVQFTYEMRTGSALAQLAEESGGRHIFMNVRELAPSINDVTGDVTQ